MGPSALNYKRRSLALLWLFLLLLLLLLGHFIFDFLPCAVWQRHRHQQAITIVIILRVWPGVCPASLFCNIIIRSPSNSRFSILSVLI